MIHPQEAMHEVQLYLFYAVNEMRSMFCENAAEQVQQFQNLMWKPPIATIKNLHGIFQREMGALLEHQADATNAADADADGAAGGAEGGDAVESRGRMLQIMATLVQSISANPSANREAAILVSYSNKIDTKGREVRSERRGRGAGGGRVAGGGDCGGRGEAPPHVEVFAIPPRSRHGVLACRLRLGTTRHRLTGEIVTRTTACETWGERAERRLGHHFVTCFCTYTISVSQIIKHMGKHMMGPCAWERRPPSSASFHA